MHIKAGRVITAVGNYWLNVQNSAAVDSRALNWIMQPQWILWTIPEFQLFHVRVFCLNQKWIRWLEVFPLHHSAAHHLYVQHQGGAAMIYFRQAWDVFVSLLPQTSHCGDAWIMKNIWENCEHASKIRIINILSLNTPSLKCQWKPKVI